MNLLQKSRPLAPGYNPIMCPGDFPLKYLKLGRLFLTDQQASYTEDTGDDEVAISILSGTCNIRADGEDLWEALGGRKSMLSGPPTMAYIPRNRKWSIEKSSEILHAAVFRATARRDTAPVIVRCDQAKVLTIGTGAWKRSAAMSIVENVDADRLLVGETYNLPGQWSSYPPHKHDTEVSPKEAWYEEIYHFAVEPQQGFGIQRVYTQKDAPDPLDEVYVIEDGDTVAIPRGYHPVVAGGGYRVGYLWALAGEQRSFGAFSVDPSHAWISDLTEQE